jgi:CheY-like chemotaxis protein/two-component sensor histidine kinase
MLSHLLDDLLDVSRLTTGRVHLNLAPILLAEVLRSASEAVRPLMQERQHNLVVKLYPENLTVRGDHLRLVQVAANLLNNAAKYTDPGGRIEIVAAPQGEHDVLLSVIDNGIGISADALTRIFSIFAQVESERERSRGGLGIGLFLVKGLVELHNGSIRVSSEGRGRGTRVDVTLPRALPPVPLPSTDARFAGKGQQQRKLVLVVDDNVDAAVSLKTLLEVSGSFEADVAHSGEEALLMVAEGNYDAVCVDIGLPGIDGYEVARRLRSRTEANLVATTGWGTVEDKRRALESGFDSHLTKPVDPDELIRALQA